ncbi:hypothetical protein PQX77_017819 [Marasmius sp. AFHP31]|nr:hypothetical protein PQX77_017819 [Marasmius sp. AFHP31]
MNVDTPQASINTIPVEILTEIFGYFLPKGNALDPPIPPLVTFVSVCRHWRQASLNAPYLWSTIRLYNPRPSRIQMLRQWLERSKACPLTLMLEIYPRSSGDRAEWTQLVGVMEEVLSILIRQTHRWKHLDLQLIDFPIHPKSPLLRLPTSPGAAPLLEQVCISESASFTVEAVETMWRVIGGYSGVRHVLWHTGLERTKSCLTQFAAWSSITHLSSHFVFDDHFLHFLSQSHMLEDLCVSLLESTDSALPLIPNQRLCLPNLRKLNIPSSSPTALAHFLDHLELPTLYSLRVVQWHSGDAWIRMLQHSSCQLKTLELCDRSLSDGGITQLLASPALAQLEELSIQLWCPASQLLWFLTLNPDATALHLPYLRKMIMSFGGFTMGLLSTMLKSRLYGTVVPRALTHINLSLGLARAYGDISADMSFLKHLHETGFDITYE